MKKWLSLLLAVLMATALFGCGKASLLSPDEPVTLTMWHVYGEQADTPMNRLVEEFNATVGLEKGIVVTVTNVTSSSKINAQLQKVVQDMGYEKVKQANHVWFHENPNKVNLKDIPDLSTPYVLDDIEIVLGRLMECGFDSVIAVDLTRPEVNVPTVRMIVPGLEVSTMDPEREGGRLRGMWPPA